LSLEFSTIALNDIVSLVIDYRGKTPKKLGADWSESGIRALSAKNIKTGKIIREDAIRYVDRELYHKWMKDEIKRNDILITSEAPFGEVFFWDSDEKIVLSQRLFGVRCDENKVDPKFIYFYMTSEMFQWELQSRATGTTVKGLRQPELLKCEIQLPNRDNQTKISYILSNIESKINVLKELNRNLEAIASNVFKNYFIDFEPFQELTLIDSNIGNIPKEWEFTKLEDIIDVKDGTHDSPSAIDDGFPLITSKHLNEYDVNKNEANRISFEDYTNINKRSLVEPFDILISMIGTVGNICYIMYDEVDFAIKNVGLFKTSQTPLIREYLLLYLKSSIINHYIDSRLAGSTQKYISLTELRNIPIVIPPNEVLKEFKNIVNPIFNNIKINHFEINNLIKLRDTLLPKLMSGEIDVSKINCDLE